MTSRRALFLSGVFILCASALMLQIIETRVLSVVSHYYLAFFAVSIAMLGMTVGSLIVYFNQNYFSSNRLFAHLTWISCAFALTIVLSTIILITTVLLPASAGIIMSGLQWFKLIAALAPSYVLAGMGVSIALTRSPWPVGLVYGSDLAGAAFGCLGALAIMNAIDGVSAMLMVGALGAAAGLAFAFGSGAKEYESITFPPWLRLLFRPGILITALSFLALGNAAIYPRGLALFFSKGHIESPQEAAYLQWNSYSRIRVEEPKHERPAMWGASPSMPPIEVDQRGMSIDGGAGTAMYRFGGKFEDVDFLKYDLTNLAYYIRNKGRAAVIGVGGGRDLLAAFLFGFRDVTGVELNSIFIDLLTRRFRDFNHLADVPGVRFETDEARSWFASKGRNGQFDLVQMSLIDTWAATSVGAFSLSENGLYTVQGWRHFLNSLAPNGVFTVSRWYAPSNASETGRLLSLAKAALLDAGVLAPDRHLFLASLNNLSTLIVGREPLSLQDIAKLRETSSRLGFSVLVSPDARPAIGPIRDIMDADGPAALETLSARWHIDVTAPTDDRPFFFNQLRIADPAAMIAASRASEGVFLGNLWATMTLLIIVLLSFAFVLFTIIVPALPSTRKVAPRLMGFGTAYFLSIGLGFMCAEIGTIQRLSLFLGHPVYGLAIGLFAIILSTGIGSLISDRLPICTIHRVVLWSGLTVLFLAALPSFLPFLSSFEGDSIVVRACVAVAMIAPIGLLMGFGFPTGMRLVNRVDTRPTPWFWAINGAAGVLGASIAVTVNIAFSINVSIWLAAACYLVTGISAIPLMMTSSGSILDAAVEIEIAE